MATNMIDQHGSPCKHFHRENGHGRRENAHDRRENVHGRRENVRGRRENGHDHLSMQQSRGYGQGYSSTGPQRKWPHRENVHGRRENAHDRRENAHDRRENVRDHLHTLQNHGNGRGMNLKPNNNNNYK